jgi:hypothetical protein
MHIMAYENFHLNRINSAQFERKKKKYLPVITDSAGYERLKFDAQYIQGSWNE